MFFKMEYNYINKILVKCEKCITFKMRLEDKTIKLNYEYMNHQPNQKAVNFSNIGFN